MDTNSNELLHGKMNIALLKFAIPFMFTSFLQVIYGAVDIFVVGQYADSASVSAVSIGSQLMSLVVMLVAGLSMGGTVEIGIRIGEDHHNGIKKAVGNLTVIFLVMALVLTPILFMGTPALIELMRTPTESVDYCKQYMFVCSMGLPFIIGYNVVSGIYRGTGDSKTPVIFVSIACVINIILDFILTGVCQMGAFGAACATVIAQVVSFLCSVIRMALGGFKYALNRTDFLPDPRIMQRILRVGFPLAFQNVLIEFSFLVISAIINTLGVVASAAVGVANKLMGFAFLIPGAFGAAIATVVAQNLGAGQQDRTREALKWGIAYSVTAGIVVCVLCFTIPDILIGFFTKDSQVIKMGATYIGTYSIDCILTGFVFCINGYLNGNRKTLMCFAHSIAATFFVRIPMTLWMSRYSMGTLLPMGFAAPAASFLSIIICSIYLRKRVR